MYQAEINQHYLKIRWKGKRKKTFEIILTMRIIGEASNKINKQRSKKKNKKATTFSRTNSIGTMFKQGKRTSKQTHSYTIISKTWFLTTLLAMIFPKKKKLYTTTFLLLIKQKKNRAKLRRQRQWWAKGKKNQPL